MVRSGHSTDGAIGRTAAPGWAGVGTFTLRDVCTDPAHRRPLLLDHHSLLLVTAGHGTHDVDFHTHQCRPGTLIWARPGQVIRYGAQPGLDAIIVCWEPDVLASLDSRAGTVPRPTGLAHWQLAGEDEDAVISEVSQLVVDCQRHRPAAPAAELLRHQLAVLLLRLALLPADPGGPAGTPAFERLCGEVERSYRQTRRVADYAARLGCSVRTLTRTCLVATGRSAKQVIDDRVALQAKRLLAATDESVAEIGRSLGFPEPTNFGRFFQREVGRTPGAFRAAVRYPSPGRLPGQRPPEATDAPAGPAPSGGARRIHRQA